MPFDFDPSGIAAHTELGDNSSHAPQIRFTAPNKSCLWNQFPVYIKCRPFSGCNAPTDPPASHQINGYSVTFGAGPFTPPDSDWPFIHLYGILNPILCGYTWEYRVTGTITFGSSQIGVANPLTGCSGCSDATYYNSSFDTGWQSMGTPTCAQAATATDDHTYLTLAFRPFNPIVGFGIVGGTFRMRWVGGGGTPPDFDPNQSYAIGFFPPSAGGSRILFLGHGDSASPPSSDWANSIIPGDSGMQDDGATNPPTVSSVSGHGSMWYQNRSFDEAQAIYAVCLPGPTPPDALYLYARLSDPGTSSVDGYVMEGTLTTAKVYRINAGVLTLLDTFSLQYPMTATDAFIYRFFVSGAIYGVQANMDVPNFFGSDLPFVGGGTDPSPIVQDGFVGVGLDATGAIAQVAAGAVNETVPGLTIYLPTDSCGVLSKTYNQIKTTFDAMNLAGTNPILASIIAHGGDIAEPDLNAMYGAHCTGGTYWREGMETP